MWRNERHMLRWEIEQCDELWYVGDAASVGFTQTTLSYNGHMLYLYVSTNTRTHTQTFFPQSIFALHFLTASYTAYTHTWHFIFVSIFWVLQLPTGLWTPVSLCMAIPWAVPTFTTHRKSTLAGSFIPMLTSIYSIFIPALHLVA